MTPNQLERARNDAEDATYSEDRMVRLLAYLLLIVLDAKEDATDARH